VDPADARVRFVGFGSSSLDLEIFAYIEASGWVEFLAIQEDLLLRIMDTVSKSGTGIAFPSQTTYAARDKPLDSSKAAQAEMQVSEWREKNKLPDHNFYVDTENPPDSRDL
jgi:MscS family membrane protein